MNQPKERPILFKGEMVNAILPGWKNQTRRLVKLPDLYMRHPEWLTASFGGKAYRGKVRFNTGAAPGNAPMEDFGVECPYGKPGDRLWVRESHAFSVIDPEGNDWREDPDNWDVVYRADNNKEGLNWRNADGEVIPAPWRPSIHMPRWASRILLEITDVRVERLQDINEADAKAEGVTPNCSMLDHSACGDHGNEFIHYMNGADDFPAFSAVESFESLWQSINGPDSWEANPWVWVVEFKRVE